MSSFNDARKQASEAMARAVKLVKHAVNEVKHGKPVPEDVRNALQRSFPTENEEFLPLLLRRIELAGSIIPHVRIRYFAYRADFAVEPHAEHINFYFDKRVPAAVVPSGRPRFIAVFPPFVRQKQFQATRLIHEAFHYYFPSFIRHSRRNQRGDAFAYQMFVSELTETPHMLDDNRRPKRERKSEQTRQQ